MSEYRQVQFIYRQLKALESWRSIETVVQLSCRPWELAVVCDAVAVSALPKDPPAGMAGSNKEHGRVLTMLLHDGEELDDNLGARPDEDLTLSGLLGIVDVLEGVVENRCLHHLDVCVRVSNRCSLN